MTKGLLFAILWLIGCVSSFLLTFCAGIGMTLIDHNDIRDWLTVLGLLAAFPFYLVGLRSKRWAASLLGVAYLGLFLLWVLWGVPHRPEDVWYHEMYLVSILAVLCVPRKHHPISPDDRLIDGLALTRR